MSTTQQKHDKPAKGSTYVTSQGFVDYINNKWGIGLKRSRLAKDRMKQEDGSPGIAPEPVARFGNRDLYDPEQQAPEYVEKLITRLKPEPERDQAA
jgi:hypothetical protein